MKNDDVARTASTTSAAAQVKRVNQQAKRMLNRGLEHYIWGIVEGFKPEREFTAGDLEHEIDHTRWPHADHIAISATLPTLAKKGKIVRVAGVRSGLYRRASTTVATRVESPTDDARALENALSALADVERIVRRHQAIIERLRAAGIRIEE